MREYSSGMRTSAHPVEESLARVILQHTRAVPKSCKYYGDGSNDGNVQYYGCRLFCCVVYRQEGEMMRTTQQQYSILLGKLGGYVTCSPFSRRFAYPTGFPFAARDLFMAESINQIYSNPEHIT